MKKPEVALDGVSRLRKLKKKEKKEVIGGVEFEKRLKDQYTNITKGASDLFNWAKSNKDEN